jgi:hypothetical protein
MLKTLLIVTMAVFLGACDQRTCEEAVESRLSWLLEPAPVPASCQIKASTIDSWDDWPTYQIEVRIDEADFKKIVDSGGYRHEKFADSRLPYEQHIELATPFMAHGVYRRQVHGRGTCSLFYSDDPTRYFILYLNRLKK